MTSPFALNTLVWLKQPGYPWWPGIVIDPDVLEMEMREGCNTCVLCMPSVSSTVAFADGNNAEEVIRFRPESDADLLEAGREDTECASAIEEALSVYEQQQKPGGDDNDGDDAGVVRDVATAADGAEYEHDIVGHKRKKERSHKKTDKRQKRRQGSRERVEPPLAGRHRQKRRGEARGGIDRDDDDDSNVSSDDSNIRKRKKGKEGDLSRRGVKLDELERNEEETRLASAYQNDGVLYLDHLISESRKPASDSALEHARQQLVDLAAACVQGNQIHLSDAIEAQLLDLFASLTLVDVTVDQLRRTRVGVAVGKFLSGDYPPRVVSLASAILTYWFYQLPPKMRQRLIKQKAPGLAEDGMLTEVV